MNAVLLLGAFFLFLAIKIPVAISLILASFFGIFVLDIAPFILVGQAAFNTMYSYTVLAIPFYIFAGMIMTRGGISKKLCDVAEPLFVRFTGGYGMVTICASTFFAALCGSSTATTAAIGSMMVPEMEKAGYRKPYGLAIAAAGGIIGPIIPPSVSFVTFGVATGVSIGDLFIAGIVPGALMAIALCVCVYITAKKNGYSGAKEKLDGKRLLKAIWAAKWAALVPVIILGGIYGGIFTPTEAGAAACIYSIFITMVVERTLSFKGLIEVAREGVVTASSIMFLIGAAGIFGRVMTLADIPQLLTSGIMSISISKVTFIVLVNLLLLAIGCVMEAGAANLIVAPLLLPIALSFGFHPIHYAIMHCLNTGIGAITPPVGACLFVASVIGETKFEVICREIIPFVLSTIVVLILVAVFEPISTIMLTLIR